ncbi:MAG: hypothetical protein NVSMB57_16000 [Actinomycetota bacterium]
MVDRGAVPRSPQRVVSAIPLAGYIFGLSVLSIGAAFWLASSSLRPPGHASNAALPVLAGLVIAAEYLFVRFRFHGETNALNLVEAALAPLVWAFAGPVAIVTVALAQLIAEILRRNAPLKAMFNIAQWTLATAAGSAVIATLTHQKGITAGTVSALLASLAAIATVNHICFTLVLSIANRNSPWRVLRTAVLIRGWYVPWITNWLIGLLYVLAYTGHPVATVLFPVPLIVLHFAYRGYAGVRSDRARLAGLHQAATVFAEPLDPRTAIKPFLAEVIRCFEARAAALVLMQDNKPVVYRFDQTTREFMVGPPSSIESALLTSGATVRVTTRGGHPASSALCESGWHDCLAAPLIQSGETRGLLLVYDQAGLEGFEAGEIAVIEALARETMGTLAKGALLEAVLEERRTLSDIVGSTSDGIFTVSPDGRIMSWNPAMERITGVHATDVVGREDGHALLRVQTLDGAPVDLCKWATISTALPNDLRVVGTDGRLRSVSCSYSTASDANGPHTFIAVMRDVSQHEEMAALREQYGRLAEAEATQRAVVEQLQAAVMPARPDVDGVELGVSYLSSDPSAPTGGDLYDWYVLPSGELHIAVVDVLGHGVGATQDAIAVVHTLRLLAVQNCPLDKMVERADGLLAQRHRDLVATCIVARHDPKTGRARLAGGGHPPPLLVSKANARVTPLVLSGGPIG